MDPLLVLQLGSVVPGPVVGLFAVVVVADLPGPGPVEYSKVVLLSADPGLGPGCHCNQMLMRL